MREFQAKTITKIVERYLDKSRKVIAHYGDCEIYRADRPFCGCGLLHELGYLYYNLANIVYPNFDNDMYLQETGRRRRRNKKKITEAKAILESIFGKIEPLSLADIKYDYDRYKSILDICYLNVTFPGVFRNLKTWLKKSIKERED